MAAAGRSVKEVAAKPRLFGFGGGFGPAVGAVPDAAVTFLGQPVTDPEFSEEDARCRRFRFDLLAQFAHENAEIMLSLIHI